MYPWNSEEFWHYFENVAAQSLDKEREEILPDRLSVDEVRNWYNAYVSVMLEYNEEWEAEGVSSEERAYRCYTIRHRARIMARELGGTFPRYLAEWRDLWWYGNRDGPLFDDLVKKGRQRSLRD